MAHYAEPEPAPSGLLAAIRNGCLIEGAALLVGGVVLWLTLAVAGGRP